MTQSNNNNNNNHPYLTLLAPYMDVNDQSNG